jgi:hypothetical protein
MYEHSSGDKRRAPDTGLTVDDDERALSQHFLKTTDQVGDGR